MLMRTDLMFSWDIYDYPKSLLFHCNRYFFLDMHHFTEFQLPFVAYWVGLFFSNYPQPSFALNYPE